MAGNVQRKRRRQRWFARAAEVLAHRLPAAREIGVPVYMCPICQLVWSEEALTLGRLTDEDVPPKSLGGRPLVLTCHKCNHAAGAGIDAEARKRQHGIDLTFGQPLERRVVLTGGGVDVQARLVAGGNGLFFEVVPKANAPGAIDRFMDVTRSRPEIAFSFEGDAYLPHHARVSWLKSAYLAMFALFGYDIVLAPNLDVVRQQIREPHTELIHGFLLVYPQPEIDTKRRTLIRVTTPSWLNCWAIVMGRHAVFLPDAGDHSLYQRIEEHRRENERVPGLAGRFYDWPSRPWEHVPPKTEQPPDVRGG